MALPSKALRLCVPLPHCCLPHPPREGAGCSSAQWLDTVATISTTLSGTHSEVCAAWLVQLRNTLILPPPHTGYMVYSSGSVVVLDHFSASPQGHLVGHSSSVSALTLQSDGQTLASASVSKGEVLLWDIPSLTCTGQLRFHSSAVSCLAYSRDDRFLATVGR